MAKLKNHRPTAEMRAIVPSSPWHRWRRGEIELWQAVWDSLPEEEVFREREEEPPPPPSPQEEAVPGKGRLVSV